MTTIECMKSLKSIFNVIKKCLGFQERHLQTFKLSAVESWHDTSDLVRRGKRLGDLCASVSSSTKQGDRTEWSS